jgi:hypothetical protein
LRFDNQLTPHLSASKPPTAVELVRAKWGIGGRAVCLRDAKVWTGADRAPDSRTAVAIDGPRKLLFLAVGQNISPRLMLQESLISGPRTGRFWTAGTQARWRLAKMPQAFQRGISGRGQLSIDGPGDTSTVRQWARFQLADRCSNSQPQISFCPKNTTTTLFLSKKRKLTTRTG